MRLSKFILVGILFGVVLYKAEAVSWFRIFEMFHFQSFHMYGIIGSAIVVAAVWGLMDVAAVKRYAHVRRADLVAAVVGAAAVTCSAESASITAEDGPLTSRAPGSSSRR